MAGNKNCSVQVTGGKSEISKIDSLSETVKRCIEKLLEKKGFYSYQVDVKNISTNGGNYLGQLQTVDIKKKSDGCVEEINLFIKNILNSNENFNYFPMSEVYLRESYVYQELLAKYAKFQEQHKIPEAERFNIVKSYNGQNSEAIVLENLAKVGFETVNRRDVISLKFAEISIAQLAKYHGLSFVLQRKEPKYFEAKIKSLTGILNFSSEWDVLIRRFCDTAIDCLEGEARTKLDKFYPVFLKKYEHYFYLPEEQRVCLCHGDFRANNILMKKTNGEVSKVFVIDYQFISHSSPVLDLIYFIFGGTDQRFRDEHLDHFRDYYYDSFENYLGYYGLRAGDVYSRKRFEQDFREKLDFGLMTFVILMPFLFATDDDVPDLHEMDAINFTLADGYKQRIREMVDYFIREGYL